MNAVEIFQAIAFGTEKWFSSNTATPPSLNIFALSLNNGFVATFTDSFIEMIIAHKDYHKKTDYMCTVYI